MTSQSESFLESIRNLLGPRGWTTDPDALAPLLTERRGLWHGNCAMAAFPATTAEVAGVVTRCFEAGVPVVPQGGNTGLVGGAVPSGGILLSLRRMNRIRDIDAVNFTLTAEAGCVLADLQAAADAADRLFPLSLGAEGSCQIGGNLATNAGGTQVLRYGNARELTLGLEAVLPDGRVWDGLRALRKNNTGYDLKQLFIGAEGTLGVITAVVLKLFPKPGRRATAMAALGSGDALLKLFELARAAAADRLTAFEFMARRPLEMVIAHVPGARDPFDRPYAYYALVELSGAGAEDGLQEILAAALEAGDIDDAAVAQSDSQAEDFWKLRETIPEAQTAVGASIKHDVSVPVSRVPEFLAAAEKAVTAEMTGIRVVAFGHIGDGNVHFNLSQPEDMDGHAFLDEWDRFNRIVHDIVFEMGGSFSAEHGIGQLKTDELARYKSAAELDLMRALKHALDPKGIMNPGKVIGPAT